MEYRPLGKTRLNISALSFGCMRFADEETAVSAIRKAVELGVNYFDVAPLYGGGTAEPRVGVGLKGLRDKVMVMAKSSPGNGGNEVQENYSPESGFGVRSADDTRRQIDRSMKILGIDHLDFYHLWTCSSDAVFDEAMKPGGFLEGVRRAQSEGLVDHIGITGHADSDTLIRFLKGFDFELVTIPFSVLDTSRAKAVEYCCENGIALVAMNPLAGGALIRPSSTLQHIAEDVGCKSMSQASLRYLLGYPGVTTSLAGMTYAEHVIDGAEAIDRGALSHDKATQLRDKVHEVFQNVKHFCTGCGYCGECPEGILIPKVLEVYTSLLIPSNADAALTKLIDVLDSDPTGYNPSLCSACGICESKCPNKLPVSQLMTEASEKWKSSI